MTNAPTTQLNYDILCAGMSAGKGDDPNHTIGTVIATGGMNDIDTSGIPNTSFFQPSTTSPFGTWKAGPVLENMNNPRFYPSNVQEPSGNTLIIGGTAAPKTLVHPIEEWAGTGWSLTGPDVPTQTSLYPRVKLVPESQGEFVMAGERAQTFIWDAPGGSAWNPAGTMSNPGNDRADGGVVILPLTPGGTTKLFTAGGNTLQDGAGCPTNTDEIYTVGAVPPWQAPAGNQCMCYARYNENLVLLANGTVLAVGGGNGETGLEDYSGPIPAPELFDPTANTWKVLAPAPESSGNPVNRTYHSTALLLPDGRVISAGSDTFSKGLAGTNDNKFQIFSPPYMFATRPTISSVSGSFTYGSTITIVTPDANSIFNGGKVALVRPGAATHASDFEQRYVQLTFTQQDSQTLLATLPASNGTGKATAPPGFYMLFIVNSSNVPSASYMTSSGTFLQLQ